MASNQISNSTFPSIKTVLATSMLIAVKAPGIVSSVSKSCMDIQTAYAEQKDGCTNKILYSCYLISKDCLSVASLAYNNKYTKALQLSSVIFDCYQAYRSSNLETSQNLDSLKDRITLLTSPNKTTLLEPSKETRKYQIDTLTAVVKLLAERNSDPSIKMKLLEEKFTSAELITNSLNPTLPNTANSIPFSDTEVVTLNKNFDQFTGEVFTENELAYFEQSKEKLESNRGILFINDLPNLAATLKRLEQSNSQISFKEFSTQFNEYTSSLAPATSFSTSPLTAKKEEMTSIEERLNSILEEIGTLSKKGKSNLPLLKDKISDYSSLLTTYIQKINELKDLLPPPTNSSLLDSFNLFLSSLGENKLSKQEELDLTSIRILINPSSVLLNKLNTNLSSLNTITNWISYFKPDDHDALLPTLKGTISIKNLQLSEVLFSNLIKNLDSTPSQEAIQSMKSTLTSFENSLYKNFLSLAKSIQDIAENYHWEMPIQDVANIEEFAKKIYKNISQVELANFESSLRKTKESSFKFNLHVISIIQNICSAYLLNTGLDLLKKKFTSFNK
jgi:hypothetical protein